jgi:hypothetical protein
MNGPGKKSRHTRRGSAGTPSNKGKTSATNVGDVSFNRRAVGDLFTTSKKQTTPRTARIERTQNALQAAAKSWAGREFTVSKRDRERAEAVDPINVKADTEELEKLYTLYYKTRETSSLTDRQKSLTGDVYDAISGGPSTYLRSDCNVDDLHALSQNAEKGGYTMGVQGYIGNDLKAALESLKKPKGDYVMFDNAIYPLEDKDTESRKGIARRIMVNLTEQKPGLDIAKNLTQLFTDDKVSPFFRKFKIRLSTAEDAAEQSTKYDKIVIYYTLGRFDENGHDTVGDEIVAKIMSAAKAESFDAHAAPFFCYVAPGIYWAEEPKYHAELEGSYSTTRAKILADVISRHAEISDESTFIGLVNNALEKAGVDPKRPYLHLGKKGPVPLGPLPPSGQST